MYAMPSYEERPSAGIAEPFEEDAEGDQVFGSDSTSDAGELRMVALDEIVVANRYRKDLGDVRDLAASIADIGLINPITLTPDYELLAGGRRLEAHRTLGLAEVPARIVHTIADARDRLVAERDENTKRKPMLPSESAALGMAIEELERPAALERQSPGRPPKNAGPGTRVNREARPRDIAAEAIGMPESTYRRIKQAIETVADETQPEEVRDIARDAVAQIDAGAAVRPQAERIRDAKARLASVTPIKPVATETASPDVDIWSGITDRYPTARRAFVAEGSAWNSFESFQSAAQSRGVRFKFTEQSYPGYVNKQSDMLDRTSLSIEVAMQTLDDIDLTVITPELAADALERIDGVHYQLASFVKQLKEISNV